MRKGFALLVCLFIGLSQEAGAAFQVKEFTTAQGIRVRHRHDPSTPVISFLFSLQCGSAQDKAGREGTAILLASMMSEGTESKTVEEYASFLQDRAISLGHTASTEYFTVSLTTLRKYKDDAFSILKESFWTPSFSPDAFDRAKKEILTAIALKATDPSYQAKTNLQKLIYKDHPYAKLTLGTTESVQSIQITDLKNFHKQFSRKDVLIAVSGNISREEIEAYVNDLCADLPETSTLETVPELHGNFQNVTVTVPQEIPQTIIAFAQKGMRHDDKRFLIYTLLNKILSRRLMDDVRETNGLAYYISTSPATNKAVGLLQGVSATKNQSVQKTLQRIQSVFNDLKDKGLTDAEFSEMKAYALGTFVLNFSDTPRIAAAILNLMRIGRSPEYIDQRNSLVEKITKAEVESVAKDILNPEAMTIVLYGSPEGLKPESGDPKASKNRKS